jgi:hypothetical protein
VRLLAIGVAVLLAIAAAMAALTPWWFYPDAERWELGVQSSTESHCVFIGDTLRLRAARRGTRDYRSTDAVPRFFRRFHWRTLEPTDSFWVARRWKGDYLNWHGDAEVDDVGRVVGTREGHVGIEVREGSKRSIANLTVLPPLNVEIVPAEITAPLEQYVDVEIRATFPDGTAPPSYYPPALRGPLPSPVVNQAISTRGRPYAPWHALVRVSRPGPDTLVMRYHTRAVPVLVRAGASTAPVADEALVDSVRRARFPQAPIDTAPPPQRWRNYALGRNCS